MLTTGPDPPMSAAQTTIPNCPRRQVRLGRNKAAVLHKPVSEVLDTCTGEAPARIHGNSDTRWQRDPEKGERQPLNAPLHIKKRTAIVRVSKHGQYIKCMLSALPLPTHTPTMPMLRCLLDTAPQAVSDRPS